MTEENIFKGRILEAAKAELREKGLRSSSMRSVAARAGIAVGTIYNYVANKDGLFHQVLLQSWQELEQGMTKLLESNVPVREKLVQVGLLQLNFMSYHREIWWDNFTAKEPISGSASGSLGRQTYERYLNLLEHILHQARETKEIKLQFETLTDKELATAIVMLINSLKPFWHQSGRRLRPHSREDAEPTVQTRVQAVQEILDVFLYGLCRNSPSSG